MAENVSTSDDQSAPRSGEIYDRIVATATSVALAIGAIVATFFAVLEWRSDQPSASVAYVRSDIRTLLIDLAETREKLNSIEQQFASFTGFGVINLIEETRGLDDSDKAATDTFVSEIKSTATGYEDSSTDDSPETGRIAKALNEIAAELEQQSQAPELKFEIQVDIENDSNSPNIIRGHALVRLWKDGDSYRDIDVYLQGEDYLYLDRLTIQRVTFESRYTGTMDEQIAEFLQRNSVTELNCLMVLKDIDGNTWSQNNRCVTDIGVVTAEMRDEAKGLFITLSRQ